MSPLPSVTAKIVIFSGYAVGTSLAGFLSDYMGRKAAIAFFSQLLFGTGIIATVMPNMTGFIIVWFFVGKFLRIFSISKLIHHSLDNSTLQEYQQ